MLGLEVEVAAREQGVTLHLVRYGGKDLPYSTSMVRVEGREGRQSSYAIAVGSGPVQPLYTEETSSIQPF